MLKPVQTPERGSEADLIARAMRRDPEAVRTITTQHNRRLYRLARSILRNDDEAEDALQTAYMKAFASLADFRRESSLTTWLSRIVINEALCRVRNRKQVFSCHEDGAIRVGGQVFIFPGPAGEIDPERAMAQKQIQAALETAIDELPDLFRTVLVARVIEGMSPEETAAALDLRLETVKTRLHRARRLLRIALERRIGPVMMDAFPFEGWRCERMTARIIERLKAAE
jgi:RNA polymerase sigma-70 factor (ECF subfamily)